MSKPENTFDKIIKKEIKSVFEKEFDNLKDFYGEQLKEFLSNIINEDKEEELKNIAKSVIEIILKDKINDKIDKKLKEFMCNIFERIIESNNSISYFLKNNNLEKLEEDIGLISGRLNRLESVITSNINNKKLSLN